MLEEYVGKEVKITMKGVDGAVYEYYVGIIEVEGPLLKTDQNEVINTNSPCFVKLEIRKKS